MDDLPEDINHAIKYAEQFIIKHRYDNQHTETRWQLPPYLIEEEYPNYEIFYIPQSLRHDFKMFHLKFDETGCKKLNCFRYTEHGKPCSRTSLPIDLEIANQTYPACQEACTKNWVNEEYPFIDEVDYINGKCMRQNTLFKRWCLFPETRSDEPHQKYIPPFLYDDSTQDCLFTREYCDRYGLNYENDICQRSNFQAFAEDYLIGQTVYRSVSLAGKSNVTKQKRSTQDESIEQFMKEIAFDTGIDLSFWSARQLALKSIPLYSSPAIKILLANLEKQYGKMIVKHAVRAAIIHSIKTGVSATIAIKAAACIGTAATIVGLILLAVQLTGLIADILDPFRLNDLLDAEFLADMKRIFKNQLMSIFNGDIEITPLHIMTIMTKAELNEEERILLITKIATYLSSLDINSKGEDTNYTPQTLEDYLYSWISYLHNETPQELEKTMNSHFTKFSIIFSVLFGIFLAVSV